MDCSTNDIAQVLNPVEEIHHLFLDAGFGRTRNLSSNIPIQVT